MLLATITTQPARGRAPHVHRRWAGAFPLGAGRGAWIHPTL